MSSISVPYRAPVEAPPRTALKRRAITAVRVLLAVQFAAAGMMKLAGVEVMVQMFDDIGVGQWLRYTVGAIEVAAAVGLLVPVAAGAAAVVVIGIMLGAIVTRLAVLGGPPVLEVVIIVLAGLVVRQHGEQVRRLVHAITR